MIAVNKNSLQFPLRVQLRRTSWIRNSLSICCVLICLLAFQRSSSCSAADPKPTSQKPIDSAKLNFFESRIRPVLSEQCYSCHHSHGTAESDVILDHRKAIRAGNLIVPGDPSASRLLAIIQHKEAGLEMPQDGPKLADSVIKDFEQWIQDGAEDPREQPPAAEDLTEATSWSSTLERRKGWWSFRAITDPSPPQTSSHLSQHPVDRFVDRKLKEHGLARSAPAKPSTLIRRAYLTLIGLPPSNAELEYWRKQYQQQQDRSLVTESLIDSLLENKHFGERWARHWMDWIRYAETHGSEGDPAIENAWLYRDYLIRAWNDDIPYDQLLREHIAGDLLEEPRVNRELLINESLIGTAHWRMVFHGFAPTDALDEKVRFIDDQVNAFSKAFLGMTVSCARCHNHKFDAISQKDYYAIFGILSACRPGRAVIDLPQREQAQRAELITLKNRIRQEISESWLGSLKELETRLTSGNFPTQPNGDDALLLEPFMLKPDAETASSQEGNFEKKWRAVVASFKKTLSANWKLESSQLSNLKQSETSDSEPQQNTSKYWDLSDPVDLKEWYRTGLGLQGRSDKELPKTSGQFTVSLSGDTVINELLDSGLHSNLISEKYAARLTSPDFTARPNQEVWLRLRGGGEATTRYAVQDYPRNGTVYPVSTLSDQWKWQRFDLSYWEGDNVHLEVTTARDAPLLVRNAEKSWFGITDVIIQQKGSPAPSAPRLVAAQRIVESALLNATTATKEDAAKLYRVAIQDAIVRWQTETECDNSDTQLLAFCLRIGLLPNRISQLRRIEPLVSRYRELEAQVSIPTRVPTLEETSGRSQPLYVRGDHRLPTENVMPRFLEAIDSAEYKPEVKARVQLAKDLIRDDNPLTRRVIANRIWHHLLGKGIVSTPDNLGRMGTEPSHPELLDWLANQLREQSWSLKSLIRMIVTSETWQQSSTPSPMATDTDPNNQWLSHANLRRLDAEVIRDSLLASSDQLDTTLFGEPVGDEAHRRSIYLRVIRNRLNPFLRVFDYPEPFSSTGRRDITNVPAQSLTLLNDPLVIQSASALADRVLAIQTDNTNRSLEQSRVHHAFQWLFSRSPSAREVEQANRYLDTLRSDYQKEELVRRNLRDDLKKTRSNIDALLEGARRRIESKQGDSNVIRIAPEPMLSWNFEQNMHDQILSLSGKPVGNATIADGCLVLKNGGYFNTLPIQQTLQAKTLEAWVQLDDLNQKGGGVITVQSTDGVTFDSIVFAELQEKTWLAGSNFHERTQTVPGVAETKAANQWIHIAITYAEDGTITIYRNGELYGAPYRKSDTKVFEAGKTIVSFGIRHLPAGGNRMLSARIDHAALYDYALSANEIQDSFVAAGKGINRKQLLEAMSADEQKLLAELEEKYNSKNSELVSMGRSTSDPNRAAMQDFCQALYLLKEFIFLP